MPLAIDLLKQFISEDRKHPGLKLIQGKIWKSGYESKAFISHIYPEVPEVLRYWKQRGLRLAVYSSGSVEAQKLLFSHTAYGDLTSLFSAFYDTKMGAKREKDAYQAICKDMGIDPQNVCFLSDVKEELDAAQKVGLKTIQLIRDEKVIIGSHPKAKNFSEVDQIINSALL